MSLNDLAVQEMTQLSTSLLTEGTSQHAAILVVPPAAAVLPIVQTAHDGLLALDAGPDVDVLADTVRTVDAQHDALVTQIGGQLDVEIAKATGADRDALVQARDQILPPKQRLLTRSAARKAGEGQHRAERVTPVTLALLATIPTRNGGSLADTYAQLQAKCHELSAADAEHTAAVASKRGPRRRQARKRWTAAIDLLDRALRGAGADPMPVLGAIRAAQTRQAHVAAQPAQPEPSTTPSTTPTNGAAAA